MDTRDHEIRLQIQQISLRLINGDGDSESDLIKQRDFLYRALRILHSGLRIVQPELPSHEEFIKHPNAPNALFIIK